MPGPHPPLRFGDLEVDTMARRVTFRSCDVSLTRREFDILAALASHPGWVFSSDALSPAGDPASNASPASVGVHVSNLRRKLEAAGCLDAVETVRGVGYRLARSLGSPAPADAPRPSPFVGRERELRALTCEFHDSLVQGARVCFIAGEAGIGKTRFARESASRAEAEGAAVLWGRCEPAGMPAYWPWPEMLRDLDAAPFSVIGGRERAVLSAAVPEWTDGGSAPEPPPVPGVAAAQLLETVAEVLRAASAARPLVLVLDDAQWAPEASLSIFSFVLAACRNARLLALVLYRESQVHAALSDLLGTTMGRHGSGCLLLKPLEAADVRLLVSARLGETISDELASTIHRLSGGNPFFVCELTAMLEDAAEPLGVATLDLDRLIPTPNIQGVVRARLGRLTAEARLLVEIGSLVTADCPVSVFRSLSGIPEDAFVLRLDEAIHAGLLAGAEVPGSLRVPHALLQHAVRLDIPPARRVALHASIAAAFEDMPRGSGPGASAIAYHYGEAAAAGFAERAACFALAAGRQAMAQSAFEEAISQFRRALDLTSAATMSGEERRLRTSEVQEALGDALMATAELEAAREAYVSALYTRSQADIIPRSRILARLVGVAVQQRRFPDALEFVEAAAAVLDAIVPASRDDGWRRVWADAALQRLWLYYYLRMDEAFEGWMEAEGPSMDERADARQRAEYLGVRLAMAMWRERVVPSAETLALAWEQYRAALACGSPVRACMAEALLGSALLWGGLTDEAEGHLVEALRLADEVGDAGHKMIALANLTAIARMRGDAVATRQSAQRCIECGERTGEWDDVVAAGRANLAWLAWRNGDPATAKRESSAALAIWKRTSTFPFRWLATWPLIAATLAEGNAAASVAYARDLLDPEQQRMPEGLESLVSSAAALADAGDDDAAARVLTDAVGQARLRNYA